MVTPGPEAAGALVLAFGEEALGLSPENTRSSLETTVGRSPGLPFICMHGHHVGIMFAWRTQCHARKSTCNIRRYSTITTYIERELHNQVLLWRIQVRKGSHHHPSAVSRRTVFSQCLVWGECGDIVEALLCGCTRIQWRRCIVLGGGDKLSCSILRGCWNRIDAWRCCRWRRRRLWRLCWWRSRRWRWATKGLAPPCSFFGIHNY